MPCPVAGQQKSEQSATPECKLTLQTLCRSDTAVSAVRTNKSLNPIWSVALHEAVIWMLQEPTSVMRESLDTVSGIVLLYSSELMGKLGAGAISRDWFGRAVVGLRNEKPPSNCDGWNSPKFFESATAGNIGHCLEAAHSPDAKRDDNGMTMLRWQHAENRR